MVLMSASISAATMKGFDASFYGWLKVSSTFSDAALASFNNINMVAPTHAVAQTRPQDKESRLGFQTHQSRIGTRLKKDAMTAHFEIDFVDFSKSTPTTQMVPRIRIAAVTYSWNDQKVIIGQDWDLFSPVNPFTFNYVGGYFMAGNVGFMRQQAQYIKTMGKYELGGALGLANSNPTLGDSDVELGKAPSYALRLTRKLDKGRIGLSGIYAHVEYLNGSQTSHDSYAANLFYEQEFTGMTVKTEAYYGQNTANIGLLGIGKGTSASDVKEYGTHITASYKLGEKSSLFGGVGYAAIDNKSELLPFAPQGDSLKTSVITAPGVRKNLVVRVGYDYLITEDFSFLTELSRYETESKITDNSYKTKIAGSIEAGVQLRF